MADITWQREEPTKTEKAGYRLLIHKSFRLPDGRIKEFTTMNAEGSHAAATVALTADHKVIIARQYRPGQERLMDELPGGGVEPHETDFQAAAARELREETGYEPGLMVHIGDAYKDAYTNTQWHFYLATNCTPHPEGAERDPNEFIDVELISIDQLFDNARSAKMTDVDAVFLAYEFLMKIKEGN